MSRTEFEFIKEDEQIVKQPKRSKKFISKFFLYLLVIFVILAVSYSVGIVSSSEKLSKSFGNIGLWQQFKNLIGQNDQKLLGEEEDRINVLLLGIGGFDETGARHDGPQLTDTIILASFKPSTNQVAMISIPRDLQVQIPGYGWRKINNANAFGENKEAGSGPKLAAQVISQVVNQPIHYYIRLDFYGFKKIIDDLGGVDIEVENTLDDYAYPIPGKETATTSERYEHLHIEKGLRHMDGELALKYVRSRHALGAEGSDFARSKRQQKILMAVKEKAISFSTIANPVKIANIMDTLSQHLLTNVQGWEILHGFNLGKDIKEENIIRHVFDDSPTGILVGGTTVDGAWVLQPRSGNFNQMREIVANIFQTTPQAQAETDKVAEKYEPKVIEVRNGTKIPGLALKTADLLESQGYKINKYGNAPTQDYQKTVVYNLIADKTDETAKKIARQLKAEITTTLPDWVKLAGNNGQVDIVIVLGQDQE